jgi:hypothetical protein
MQEITCSFFLLFIINVKYSVIHSFKVRKRTKEWRKTRMKEILRNRKWQLFSLVLAIALVISLSFNIYQNFSDFNCASNNKENTPMDFTFTWGPDTQKIVNGTFVLEIWLTLDRENLTITIKANDDEYDPADYIGLIFFNNSEYEPYGLFANNMTINPPILTERGLLGFPLYPPELGPHKVTFDPETGYTFNTEFPWVDQHGDEWDPARLLKRGSLYTGWNMLHICFFDVNGGGVFARFSFCIPEEM